MDKGRAEEREQERENECVSARACVHVSLRERKKQRINGKVECIGSQTWLSTELADWAEGWGNGHLFKRAQQCGCHDRLSDSVRQRPFSGRPRNHRQRDGGGGPCQLRAECQWKLAYPGATGRREVWGRQCFFFGGGGGTNSYLDYIDMITSPFYLFIGILGNRFL